MSRTIRIATVEGEEPTGDGVDIDAIGAEPDDAVAGLAGWLQALAGELSSDIEPEELIAVCEAVDQPGDSANPHRAAAQVASDVAEQHGGDGHARRLGVGAGMYLLKRRGFEPGQSPAQHWRINRVLNSGSRALDLMLEMPQLRELSVRTLFFRVLKTALRRAEVGPEGMTTEVTCKIGWDIEADEPRCHRLPDASGGEAGDEVVDWLLQELMARGLTSFTLGSVIEEGDETRHWKVDDAFGGWMGELSADQARFVAGILFSPARLGGWQLSEEDRLLDTLGVARRIDDQFVPDDNRADAYQAYLQRIEQLRRIPDDLSPTFQLDDGSTSWQGRWRVSVHPVRRRQDESRGYFVMEAGFYFDDHRGGAAKWPQVKKRSLRRELSRQADVADERAFTRFSKCLDAVVEQLNRHPGSLVDDPEAVGPSPLWNRLGRGIDKLHQALTNDDLQQMELLFRQWSVRCVDPE